MKKTVMCPRWHARPGLVLLALLTLLSVPSNAIAQLSRVGVNPDTGAAPIRGSDTAYDPVNNVYLVVGSHQGNDPFPLWGSFVNADGTPLSAPFMINGPGERASFPKVTYSPHAPNGAGGVGAFLVIWHAGAPTIINSRMVAYPHGAVSGIGAVVSPSHQEVTPGLAYSPSHQVFLAAWQTGPFQVVGAIFNNNAQPITGAFQISATIGAVSPAVAWNPYTQEFGVLYTGWHTGGATTTFARVSPAGAVLRNNLFNVTGATYAADLSFNPVTGRYLGAWFQGGTFGAEIDGAGDVVAQGLISTLTGTRDGLGLAYNPVSGTFLLAGMGASYNIFGAELNGRGARMSADTEVTSAGGPIGSFHPRVAASTNAPRWNISFMHNFGSMRTQVVATSTTGGGTTASLGTPPPTSGGGGGGSTGCSTASPGAGWTCVNGGWIPPSSGGGDGSGCSTASPGAGWTCVNGGWVPPTSGGGGSTGCSTADPFAAIGGGTCVNGGWVPGGGGGGTSNPGGCTTASPGAGWTCVNGGWVPPTSGGGGTGCATASPGSGWTCVNGGWLPPGAGGSGSGGCTTGSPGDGWTCVNGGWLPPGAGGSGSGGCTTGSPGNGWTCVNGGWLPPGSGGSGSGGCTTGSPGSGWTCVNGGWLPPGSGGSGSGGCTTGSPGSGWTCVNGGWLPPGAGGGGSSTCSTADPFAALGGGTCINGGWVFGVSSASSSSSCSTSDPFLAMGGGTCINGGWVPGR